MPLSGTLPAGRRETAARPDRRAVFFVRKQPDRYEAPGRCRVADESTHHPQFSAEGRLPRRGQHGHIRDLPASAAEVPANLKHEEWARLGVRIDRDFEPLYVIPRDKRKVVQQLKEALKEADELYIATDEDREGESIGWHLVEVLKPKVPVRRMVFHEITREAIEQALRNPRDIDYNLVEAQEARRILDRLVGYLVSPVLWRKIAPRLSAGRVQSAAVRLLVLREKERIAFVPATYWDLKALLEQEGQTFEAVLTHVGGIRVAGGKDFDEHTGRLKEGLVAGRDVILLDEAQAHELAERLRHEGWVVADVEERVVTRSPAPPFITSTLQQEASRKLGLSARQTMQIAQRLYEQATSPTCGPTRPTCPRRPSKPAVEPSSSATAGST